MKIRNRALVATGIAFMMVGAGALSAQAATANNGANTYVQEYSLWCWAATSKTVIQEGGHGTPSQCQIVNWGKGTSTCANAAGDFYAHVTNALFYGGMSSVGTVTASSISYASLQGEVNSDRVVMIRWSWDSNPSGTGHMVDIRGYNTTGSTLEYINPLNSTFQSSTYAWMVNSSTHLWTHTRWQILA